MNRKRAFVIGPPHRVRNSLVPPSVSILDRGQSCARLPASARQRLGENGWGGMSCRHHDGRELERSFLPQRRSFSGPRTAARRRTPRWTKGAMGQPRRVSVARTNHRASPTFAFRSRTQQLAALGGWSNMDGTSIIPMGCTVLVPYRHGRRDPPLDRSRPDRCVPGSIGFRGLPTECRARLHKSRPRVIRRPRRSPARCRTPSAPAQLP